MSISDKVIQWYIAAHRQLPWRLTKEPYKIWLSEIILQQTRVAQGHSYYKQFIDEYPNIAAMAAASEREILKLWQGLGYYARARNLHSTAKDIFHNHNSLFPDSFSQLRKLRGVGDYTAAAIASICFDKPHAVVDGNVYRVLSRLFANPLPIDTSDGKKTFADLAHHILDKKDPGTHNHAMMELGAMVCLPRNPTCLICPLQSDCKAYIANSVSYFPVKARQNKTHDRFFHYFFVYQNGKFLMVQRKFPGIWRNLYEFPMIEHTRLVSYRSIQQNPEFQETFIGLKLKQQVDAVDRLHVLSHQRIHARLILLSIVEGDLENLDGKYITLGFDELKTYPIHRLMELFIEHIVTVLAL